jgi:hypothetical protein
VPPGTASGLIPEVVVRRLLAIVICSFVVWGGAACGQDDGGTVKEEGSLGASSGSGSSSGDASASAPADASGSEVACVPVGDPSEADSTVEVSLDEWSIDAPERIDAGTVALATTNDGEEPHELVVVRADSLADLPRDGDGEIDETAIADDDFLGEIEPFPAGDTCDGVFDLEPADYVLFCAIVEEEDGEVESHFANGMNRVLTVE